MVAWLTELTSAGLEAWFPAVAAGAALFAVGLVARVVVRSARGSG